MGSGQRPPGKMLCANSLSYIIPQLSEIFNNISGEEKPHGEPARLGDFFVGDERFAIRGEWGGRAAGEGCPEGQPEGEAERPPNGGYCRSSSSRSHRAAEASLGIRQSPRGERVTEPTLGPSGRQLRLNCCWKNRRKKVRSHFRMAARS